MDNTMKKILFLLVIVTLAGCSEYQRDKANYKFRIYGERIGFSTDYYTINDGVLTFIDKRGRMIKLSSWAIIENERG